ncbi:MAG TPA: FMN-binding protein [Candidatus Saccharimonadia bacterium]
MKRVLVVIAVLAGVGGLIALLGYHPHSDGLSQAASSNGGGATSNSTDTPTPQATPVGGYKDGTYTGSSVDVGYGTVQVQAVVAGGKITGVNFLQMPFDASRSAMIANEAKPILQQEVISAQVANVDLVSGATSDWGGFVKSMQAALDQAK